MRTWLNQFGPEYAVPAEITSTLEDTSWGNDAAPSFTAKGINPDAPHAVLWVEHPEPAKRELWQRRFVVAHRVPLDDSKSFEVWEGDSLKTALDVFQALHKSL